MTIEEWELCCAKVKDSMASYVKDFVTPISMSEEQGRGVSWGTGSYIQGSKSTFLLTACHVVSDKPAGGRLAHLPELGKEYLGLDTDPVLSPWPVDAALFNVLNIPNESAIKPISLDAIDPCFLAVDGELLFCLGFPGYTLGRHDVPIEARLRKTWFGELETYGLPMLSQQLQKNNLNHVRFNPEIHIAIHYPSAAKRGVDTPEIALPHPKGMSGSMLWDTKFVSNFRGGIEWSPEHAKVCGVIWAALDEPEVLIASKIESIRRGLGNAIQ